MIELHDLSVFFESEAEIRPSDVPWEYSGATFEYQSGDDSVWCFLAPGEGDLRLLWRQGRLKRTEVSLTGYFDMKLENQSGVERFVAIPQDAQKQPFVLQLKPHVFFALGAV
ncbi:MAG: hypothetical protein ABL891_23455 [Burkholderiales bacterium]